MQRIGIKEVATMVDYVKKLNKIEKKEKVIKKSTIDKTKGFIFGVIIVGLIVAIFFMAKYKIGGDPNLELYGCYEKENVCINGSNPYYLISFEMLNLTYYNNSVICYVNESKEDTTDIIQRISEEKNISETQAKNFVNDYLICDDKKPINIFYKGQFPTTSLYNLTIEGGYIYPDTYMSYWISHYDIPYKIEKEKFKLYDIRYNKCMINRTIYKKIECQGLKYYSISGG
jgi:hypothetical protein